MTIWKINAADGSIAWTMNYGTAGTATGLESVHLLSDGGFVIGGYTDSPTGFGNFKSGGQIEGSKPFVAKISQADAAGSTAPSSFAWTYSVADNIGSTKSLRVDSSGKVYALVGTHSRVVKLNADGTLDWDTGSIEAMT